MASEPSRMFSVSRFGEATDPVSRWSRPMTMGAADLPLLHQVVDDGAEAGPLAVAEPADAGRQALELDLAASLADPAGQGLVLREFLEDGLVRGVDVLRLPRERRPAEGSLAEAKEGPDVFWDEAGDVEGPRDTRFAGLAADIVAVVEGLRPSLPELEHGLDVGGHRDVGPPDVVGRVLDPEGQRVLIGETVGNIAVELVVGRSLVGQDVRRDAPADELGQDVGGVPEERDRKRHPLLHGLPGQAQGLVQTAGHDVDIARIEPPLGCDRGSTSTTMATPSFMVTARGWAPPIPPRPAVTDEPALERCRRNASGRRQPGSRRSPGGCPASRYRSSFRPSSARTSSGPALRGGGTHPRSPISGRSGRWRSGPGAPRGGS